MTGIKLSDFHSEGKIVIYIEDDDRIILFIDCVLTLNIMRKPIYKIIGVDEL